MNSKDESDEERGNTWNYRVVKKDEYVGIHEAYYNGEGNVYMVTVDPVSPVGEDLDQLKTTLELMLEALDDGVLDFDQIGSSS